MPYATLTRRVCRSTKVLCQQVGDETVLLDLVGERYFGLDPVGTWIWELFADAPALEHVHRVLCKEFDADSARISVDLLALVDALAAAGLVKIE